MTLYQRGSKGTEVIRIQSRLRELGHYHGPVDGVFGGGTESAMRAFQRRENLARDGIAGPATWPVLFAGETIPKPEILRRDLAHRVLALTGSFETGAPVPECFAGLSGDFDGQGLSFGALQWNLGQGSLQVLLAKLDEEHPGLFEEVFGERVAELRVVLGEPLEEQLAWARSIQDPRFRIAEPWRGAWKTLGRRGECQAAQVQAAAALYQAGLDLCETYSVTSERAVALLFDITVQNGSISRRVRAEIEHDFSQLGHGLAWPELEVERLRTIAHRRSAASNPRWVEDVRRRKLTIAEGRGTVHGQRYDLARDFGIRLEPHA